LAVRYYTDEITGVPFAIMRRMLAQSLPGPMAFLIAALFRARGKLHWYMKPSYASGEVGDGRIIPREDVPLGAVNKWAPTLEQLHDLGFELIAFRQPDVIGAKEHCVALLLDSIGCIVATLEWLRMRGAQGIDEQTPLEFNSYAATDPEIMTARTKAANLALADMFQIKFVDTLFMSDELTVRGLYDKHLARVGNRRMYCMNTESALSEHVKRAERRFQWVKSCGLLRQLTSSEVESVRKIRLPV
jgi:hypothetical protein